MHSLANSERVLKHVLRTHVAAAAKLYYLHHLRSCAALAFGHRSTSTGAMGEFCTQGVPMLLQIGMSLLKEVLQYMSMAMLQKMLRILELVIVGFATALQRTTSPLEIGACICVLDKIELKCQGIRIATATFMLLLAGCEWHVPSWAPHHYMACSLFSFMTMQT